MSGPGSKSSGRANILFITSDQQHFATLGRLDSAISTPSLDRLAAQGTIFTRAYCANPTCTPCRASMITGRYPSQHGAWSLGTRLSESEPTVGGILAESGYRTALVGKAHFQPLATTGEFPSIEYSPLMQDLDFWRGFHGPFYGFEHVELARNHTDEGHVGQHYAIWMEENGLLNWRDHFRPPGGDCTPQHRHWSLPEEFHYNAWIAERTQSLLDEYAGQGENFLLWASFFDPHPPYLAPAPWDTMYDPATISVRSAAPGEHAKNPPHFRMTQEENPDFSPWRQSGHYLHGMHSHLVDGEELRRDVAVYYGMISLMDKYIGSILDRLDALGLAEDTLVVFTSDHGHFFGQHGLIAKGPFHYEDLIRVPFIVRQPGSVPAGGTSDALISLVDIAPSFLAAAGATIPRTMTGLDQSEVWGGRPSSLRDCCIVENRHEPTSIHLKTLVTSRYKITVYYERDYGELFDLHEDPGELVNLWDDPAHAQLKNELVKKLLFAEMGKEPMPMPRIATA